MSEDKQLADFDEEAVPTRPSVTAPLSVGAGTHSAVALGGFKDLCLKPELSRAIAENGFEHPSEVQHQALPRAILGAHILAQAKSGMGKTAVFVFALLEQMEKTEGPTKVQAVILVHARELAYQIDREFKRFNRYLPHCVTAVFYGGVPEQENIRILKDPTKAPSIVVGTPGRIKVLIDTKALNVNDVKWFVVDEFDRCLMDAKMRRDVQDIFMACPQNKQVMMFSATMTEELRNTARKFMVNPIEIYVDQQSKLTLHGLTQFYVELDEAVKLRRLTELLDAIEFNQCIIFARSVDRCEALSQQLVKMKFPAQAIHSGMEQAERIRVYDSCKQQKTRIIVATDLFGRGIDIDRINLVIQFDMATDADSYLHRVGRAGRFGTKGLTITFLTQDEHILQRENRKYTDHAVLKDVQDRFEMAIVPLTNFKEQLSQSQYMSQ